MKTETKERRREREIDERERERRESSAELCRQRQEGAADQPATEASLADGRRDGEWTTATPAGAAMNWHGDGAEASCGERDGPSKAHGGVRSDGYLCTEASSKKMNGKFI